jgi:hypothetical protein
LNFACRGDSRGTGKAWQRTPLHPRKRENCIALFSIFGYIQAYKFVFHKHKGGPMAYTIVQEKRGALIVHADHVTFKDVMGAIMSIHSNPDYASFKYVLHDMLQAKLDFSDVDMTVIVSHELGARYTNPNIKIAVVTDDAAMVEYTEAFARMTKAQVGIYSDMASARQWAQALNP